MDMTNSTIKKGWNYIMFWRHLNNYFYVAILKIWSQYISSPGFRYVVLKNAFGPSEARSIESLVPKSSNGHGGPILSLYQEGTSCFHIFSTVALQPDASPVTLNNETLPWLLRLESSQHVLPADLATTDTKTMKGNSTMPTKLCFYNPPIHAHLHHTTFPHIRMYLIVLSRDYLKSLFKKTSTRKSLQ